MVISDNLYQFGVAIDAARRDWETSTGKKADLEDWQFRDFLSLFLAQRGVMIKAIKDVDIDQIWNYSWFSADSPPDFRNALAAACGCTQVST